MTLQRKKKLFTLLYFFTSIFLKSRKSHFSKVLTHAFNQKCQFFLYLQLITKKQEILLGDFAEKKETFFYFKKQSFLKLKKSSFLKGLNRALDKKVPNSSLFTFGHNKTRYNA